MEDNKPWAYCAASARTYIRGALSTWLLSASILRDLRLAPAAWRVSALCCADDITEIKAIVNGQTYTAGALTGWGYRQMNVSAILGDTRGLEMAIPILMLPPAQVKSVVSGNLSCLHTYMMRAVLACRLLLGRQL